MTPTVGGEILTYRQDGQELTAGTSAWLETASTFSFASEEGLFTARQERSSRQRGGRYWKASRKQQGKLSSDSLGKSEVLTLERLRTVERNQSQDLNCYQHPHPAGIDSSVRERKHIMSTITTGSQFTTSPNRSKLEHYARWGIWALPVWTLLLFLGTLTHQPSYQTDFPAYASYVTTTEFLISHLVASIFGAGVGILGFTALFIVLCKGRAAPLALWALVTGVIANTLTTAVVGVAAFAQPAIGRAYLSGHMAEAVAINNDVYGTALNATALPALLLLTIGLVLFGVAVARSGPLPKLAGIGLAVGIVVFGPLGFFLADFVQSVGAALLVASTAWIAIAGWRTLRAS